MAHATPKGELLLHRVDLVLDRVEGVLHKILADPSAEFREAAHVAQIHRLAVRGCNGQALT